MELFFTDSETMYVRVKLRTARPQPLGLFYEHCILKLQSLSYYLTRSV